MDRAKDLRSYVRDNCTEGFVELELKGKPGRSNVTIKRSLSSADNKSVFVLNGRMSKSHIAPYTLRVLTDSFRQTRYSVDSHGQCERSSRQRKQPLVSMQTATVERQC